jgi:hypothetical protein
MRASFAEHSAVPRDLGHVCPLAIPAGTAS